MSTLHYIPIKRFTTISGHKDDYKISYEQFGLPLGEAPVVLVNHSLTGNAHISGKDGWWSEVVGQKKMIDTEIYSVLAFNFPGNGEDDYLLENYQNLELRDIAYILKEALDILGIQQLYAAIGGSIGGALAWELAASFPNYIDNIIPIACDWKSSDWLLAHTLLQDQILSNSKRPLYDARIHAMLCYRTPESFTERFNRSINEELNIYNVESWLHYHGEKLENRFKLQAYKLMNHLLRTIDITKDRVSFREVVSKIKGNIYLISIDTDLYFTDDQNRMTYKEVMQVKSNIHFNTITSVHGHDAFLIEYDQINEILTPIFKPHSDEDQITTPKQLPFQNY